MAEDDARRALLRVPGHVRSRLRAAAAAAALGRPQDAVRHCRLALAIEPDNRRARVRPRSRRISLSHWCTLQRDLW